MEVCVCQRGEGLDLVMPHNWDCGIYSECLMFEDIWTVNEFRRVSWQWKFGSDLNRGKEGV